MYRPNDREDVVHFNFVYDEGGMGDCIAYLPVNEYITKNHPHIVQHLWLPDYFLDFARRCLTAGPIIRGYSDSQKKFNPGFLGRSFKGHRVSNFAMHGTDYAATFLLGATMEAADKNYLEPNLGGIDLPIELVPKKYVVVCTGTTSWVRELLPKYINQICEYLHSKGYYPVFLGKDEVQAGGGAFHIQTKFNEQIKFDTGIDLRGETNMLEACKIIAESKAIVGVDNGLLHLAGCTEVPIVGGFTSVRPNHRMPYRHGVLGWNYFPVSLTKEELACSGCQSNWSFSSVMNHRFERCYYDPAAEGEEIECVKLLTADKYIEQLEKIL